MVFVAFGGWERGIQHCRWGAAERGVGRGVAEFGVCGVIERHEVLRTTFEGGPEGGGLQRIHAAMPLVIGRSDLTGCALPSRSCGSRS